jgi:hypothetical protein
MLVCVCAYVRALCVRVSACACACAPLVKQTPSPIRPLYRYMMHLLQTVSNQRYTLFGTFLTIPLGLTRALITHNMHLLDEDESDSEDEEDDRRGRDAIGQVTSQPV